MHLLFCARFINFFSFLMDVELRHFFHPKCLGVIEDVHRLFCASFHFFSFLMGVELRHFYRLSVRNILGVPSLCNLLLQKFSLFFIQTLPNNCSHIENVHLLFCARFITFFSIFDGC